MWMLTVREASGQVLLPHGAGTMPGFPSFHSKGDVFRFAQNPAFLSRSKEWCAGLMVEKPWQVKSLSVVQAELLFPSKGFVINVSARQFGNKDLVDRLVCAGAGRSLGKIDIGIRMGLQTLGVKGYSSSQSILMEAGILAELNSSSHFFMSARSLNKEMSISAGIHQVVSEEVMLGICLIKNSSKPVVFQTELLYKPARKIEIDLGFFTGIRTVYFLTGYQLKDFKIRIGARFGNYIGTIPSMAIMYAK